MNREKCETRFEARVFRERNCIRTSQTTACEITELVPLRPWPSTWRGRRQVPPKPPWLSRFPHASASSEQFSFPWRKPRNNFSHPEKTQPGSLSVAAGEASCVAKRNEPTHNTVTHDLTYELTKTKNKTQNKTKKRQVVVREDYPSTANCRTKITATVRGIFHTFRGISTFLFI